MTPCLNTGQDGEYQKGVPWPSPRFIDMMNGTIKDNLTGLIWLKNANCYNKKNWETALELVKNLQHGYCNLVDNSNPGQWRLPNYIELRSLIDYSRYNSILPEGHPFIGDQSDSYWTSNSSFLYGGFSYAMIVNLNYGYIDLLGKGSTAYIWPVRDELNILTITKTGSGTGTVTSNPTGIDCGSTCSASFNQNTQVTLTATSASNSTFAGWGGDCSGSSTTCTVTMNGAKNVTAMFNVTQCSYSINPSNASFASNGGSGSMAVTVSPSGCSGSWTAESNVSWITITSGSSGTGNGTVSYTVLPNTSDTSRTGVITIAGQIHTVTQAGATSSCTYNISPLSAYFQLGGGISVVNITASSSICEWTATSNDNWITITSGSSGTSSGTVVYTLSENTSGALRTGTITVAGQTVTIRQTDTIFTDVDSSMWSKNYILALYNNGITVGCSQNPLSYCPSTAVTRGQMAAFIIRAKYGENFTYPTTPYFTDVPESHSLFKYVQRLKHDGITTQTGIYRVNDPVSRGEMAAFLSRGFLGMQ